MINWQTLTNNLRNYKPLEQVAKEAGIDAGTLRRLARGDTSEPKFSQGHKLLNMHYDYCQERHTKKLLLNNHD